MSHTDEVFERVRAWSPAVPAVWLLGLLLACSKTSSVRGQDSAAAAQLRHQSEERLTGYVEHSTRNISDAMRARGTAISHFYTTQPLKFADCTLEYEIAQNVVPRSADSGVVPRISEHRVVVSDLDAGTARIDSTENLARSPAGPAVREYLFAVNPRSGASARGLTLYGASWRGAEGLAEKTTTLIAQCGGKALRPK